MCFGTQNLDKNFNPKGSMGEIGILYIYLLNLSHQNFHEIHVSVNIQQVPWILLNGDLYMVGFQLDRIISQIFTNGFRTRSKLVVWSYMYSNSNISREDSKNHLDHLDHDFQYVVSICFDYI